MPLRHGYIEFRRRYFQKLVPGWIHRICDIVGFSIRAFIFQNLNNEIRHILHMHQVHRVCAETYHFEFSRSKVLYNFWKEFLVTRSVHGCRSDEPRPELCHIPIPSSCE
jgi:hypothetical protein